LMTHADVVPVTARGIDSFKRVDLPFSHGAICCHGGAILNHDFEIDEDWRDQMHLELRPVQDQLAQLVIALGEIRKRTGIDLRITTIRLDDLAEFVVVKQKGATDYVLTSVADQMSRAFDLSGFYLHQNSNNLAFLPEKINKQSAVQEFIYRDRLKNGTRPIIGFGDSLTDLGFMTECHWWGTPRAGQLANFVQEQMV